MTRRRTGLAVALPVAALGAVAAVVVASGGGAGGGVDGAGTAPRAGTEVVGRRTLVDRAQLDGTLGYGSQRAAIDRLGGTLTWLPAVGAVVRTGRPLFAVDGKPVILMDGSVPAWRTLADGVSGGVDVLELERNLAALGYDPGTVDRTFTSATTAAVSRWQRATGLTRTGRVELGRVVFLPGARRIAKVEASLGSTGGSGTGSPAAWDGGGARYAYADYAPAGTSATTPGATGPATTPTTPAVPTTPTTPSTTPTTPRTTPTAPAPAPETARTTPGKTATTPSGGSGAPAGGGSPSGDGGGAAATEVLTTTSTVRVVTADLDVADQQLARVGGRALVTLPDGRRVRGRVVRVGTVASSDSSGDGGGGAADGGGGDPTVPLTIRLRSARAAGRLDQAPVSVELTRTTRRDVLAVPVAALLARSGGGYGVRVVRGAGGAAARVVTVPVEPGLFADGYVELSAGQVHAGDRVEVPR